jgi:DNA-binding transcriptional LysR family regulator
VQPVLLAIHGTRAPRRLHDPAVSHSPDIHGDKTCIPDQLPRDLLERGFADAHTVATGVAGTLRVGIYFTLSLGRHIPDIVRTFESRHPDCEVAFINTGYRRNYVDVLRAGEVDMLATRLPLEAPDITVGPILSHEERIVLLAQNDPLAERDSISYEELADRVVGDVPGFPREMMDAFIPPVTPSGRLLKRTQNVDPQVVLMRVALGEQVHPTVASFLEHQSYPGLATVHIDDLPPSETALVWLGSQLLTQGRSVRPLRCRRPRPNRPARAPAGP